MKWASIPYSFLAMTKESEYSDESRLEVRPAHGKYLFVYPFVKTRAWYGLDPKERWRIMQEHIKVGRETRASTSTPATRSDSTTGVRRRVRERRDGRVPRPRAAAADDRVEPSFTKHDTTTFTCIAVSIERALNTSTAPPCTSPLARRARIAYKAALRSSSSSSSTPSIARSTSASTSSGRAGRAGTLLVAVALPLGDDHRRDGVADRVGQRAALAHDAVDADDQRDADGDRLGGEEVPPNA